MRITRFFLIVLSIIILPFTSAFAGGHYSGPDLSGQKITIPGPWLAPQDDQFRKVIKAFTDATGAIVEYGGSDSFEQQITILDSSPNSGNPPCVTLSILMKCSLLSNFGSRLD